MGRARSYTQPAALASSAVIHGALVFAGAWLLHRSLHEDVSAPRKPQEATIEVTTTSEGALELPSMNLHGQSGPADPEAKPEPTPAAAFGGERMPRPERDNPGRAGTNDAREAALNLADSVDGLTLDRATMNRVDRSQLQRIKTADYRESLDDRRATPNPMELSFLSSGHGSLAIRRPAADRDPSHGIVSGGSAETKGATEGGPETEDGTGPEPDPGGDRTGREQNVAALGVASGGPGHDYRRSANVMLARPMVTRGRAAVPANDRGRPNDTHDSSQDVATAVASLIHSSSAGGKIGSGPGGEQGAGLLASGGSSGPGSRSAPAGTGPGALMDVGADSGVLGYFRGIERKVEPYWRNAFPDWAIAEGRSGLAVVLIVIRRDGTLASVSLVRSSHVAEFDKNVLDAVRRAAPFGPLPQRLLPGPQSLRMVFDATNPAVGRDGPGKGQRGGP